MPETDPKGKLQTSAVQVFVTPEVPLEFKLNEGDLKITYMRSSGPGGQNVNKTESACRILHVPTQI